MTYTTREIIVIVASLVAILANVFNIATGAPGTGFYLSVVVILMFVLVIAVTVKKEQKATN